ncbi:hypothetical protein AVEN_122508-1 [Araneus ventricosus]|uniref:Uncharacterized protein n=1 Tax=Araneus ventricosus TaxID=182803 RepID=A0A4Y2KB86_ARAVE|nr:hypothetical protein AVEN_122508-1 [Araneus ventricosus]
MPAGQFQLSCRHVNMADRIDASSKCELRSIICFHQAEVWFVEDDQHSCFSSEFTTIAKSHSEFCTCTHSRQRPPHNAVATHQLLEQFNWEVSDHLAYSLDLSTNFFHLFPELKNWLEGQCFQKNEEIQSSVKANLTPLAVTFFEEGIGNLLHPYDKCLDLHGDYA